MFLLLLGPALAGTIAHYPAYRLGGYLATKFSRDAEDVVSTIKIISAMLLFPLTWLVLAVTGYLLLGWWAAALVLLVIPVSALNGDNVVDRSERTPWYDGPALLEVLETLPAADEIDTQLESFRFPVQLVIRPQGALAPDAVAAGLDVEAFRDYRAYAGQITEGSVKVGDKVSVLTPGQDPRTTTVAGIDFAGESLQEAFAPQSVAIRLADEFDVARGDTIAAAGTVRESSADLYAALCWLSPKPLREGQKVVVKHGTRTVQALVRSVSGKLDLATFKLEGASSLELNDIGHAQLRLAAPLPLENYLHHRRTGAFLVIDPQDGNTLAAGLVKDHPGDHEDERYSI